MAPITLISSDGRRRQLRAKKRRIRRKVFIYSNHRWWLGLPESERHRRLEGLVKEIFGCAECGAASLGDNFNCETCVASWPEVTEEEMKHLECMQPGFIEKMFKQVAEEEAAAVEGK